jgi:hypothetical protein
MEKPDFVFFCGQFLARKTKTCGIVVQIRQENSSSASIGVFCGQCFIPLAIIPLPLPAFPFRVFGVFRG